MATEPQPVLPRLGLVTFEDLLKVILMEVSRVSGNRCTLSVEVADATEQSDYVTLVAGIYVNGKSTCRYQAALSGGYTMAAKEDALRALCITIFEIGVLAHVAGRVEMAKDFVRTTPPGTVRYLLFEC